MTLFLILSMAFWLGVAALICAHAYEEAKRPTLRHWFREMTFAAWIWLAIAAIALVWIGKLLTERI